MRLGVPEDASLIEIEQAYQDLKKVWAIEKYQDDSRLLNKAKQHLLEIDEAYKRLKEIFDAKSQNVDNQNANDKPTTVPAIAEASTKLKLSPALIISIAVVVVGILGALAFANRYSVETVGDYIVKYDRFKRIVYVKEPNSMFSIARDWQESGKSYAEVIAECGLNTERHKQWEEQRKRSEENFQRMLQNMSRQNDQLIKDMQRDERTRDIIREELDNKEIERQLLKR